MTAPGSLAELAERMPLLADAEHPLGMKRARAEAFVRAVSANGDVAGALARTSPRLAAILSKAQPSDPTRVLLGLIPALSETATLSRMIKGAAAYPLALLVSFLVAAWAILSLSIPALALMSWMRTGEPAPSYLPEVAAVAGCGGLLLVLAVLVSRGARIPGLSGGTQVLDRALVLETAAALVEERVLLPIAIVAACEWAGAPIRAAGAAVARALDTASAPVGVEALLDGEAAAILCASAQRGVAGSVLRALAEQALIDARCRIPGEVRRIHSGSMAIAGLALLALAAGWYSAYLHTAVG